MDFYVAHGLFPLKFTVSNYGGFHYKYDPFDEGMSKKTTPNSPLKDIRSKTCEFETTISHLEEGL